MSQEGYIEYERQGVALKKSKTWEIPTEPTGGKF